MSTTANIQAGAVRRVLRSTRPLAWTGRGVSLALAEAFAASCRVLGATAFAVCAAEITADASKNWDVCSVSRSGWTPCSSSRLLVAEEPDRCAGVRDVLRVPNAGEPTTAWFPSGFTREACRAFADDMGIELPVAKLDFVSGRKDVVILAPSAAAAVRLVSAAEQKLGRLGITVAEPDEFGHGLHSRVAASPQSHAVHVVGGEPDPALAAWCHELGVPLLVHRLSATAAALPLVVLMATLDAVGGRCAALGINAGERPIPDHLDRLRGSAPAGGALCA